MRFLKFKNDVRVLDAPFQARTLPPIFVWHLLKEDHFCSKKPGWMWTGLYFPEKVSHDIDKVAVVLSHFYSTYQQHLDAVKLWNYVSNNDLDCSSGPSCPPVDLLLRKSTPKSFKIDSTFLRFLNNLIRQVIRCGTSFNPHNTQIRRHVRYAIL